MEVIRVRGVALWNSHIFILDAIVTKKAREVLPAGQQGLKGHRFTCGERDESLRRQLSDVKANAGLRAALGTFLALGISRLRRVWTTTTRETGRLPVFIGPVIGVKVPIKADLLNRDLFGQTRERLDLYPVLGLLRVPRMARNRECRWRGGGRMDQTTCACAQVLTIV